MIRQVLACAILSCGIPAPANAGETAPPPSAYSAVMAAQYAARRDALAARPEEAKRIYENYLQSIGKPARSLSTDPTANSQTPSR